MESSVVVVLELELREREAEAKGVAWVRRGWVESVVGLFIVGDDDAER